MIVILTVIALIVGLVFYALGGPGGRSRYERMEHSHGPAWTDPGAKKAHARMQKLAKRNAKSIDKAVHHEATHHEATSH